MTTGTKIRAELAIRLLDTGWHVEVRIPGEDVVFFGPGSLEECGRQVREWHGAVVPMQEGGEA